MKLTEEKVFILYKDILAEIEPKKSIKEIVKVARKNNNEIYSGVWIWKLLNEMHSLGLIKKVIDEEKCIRYERTSKGERILRCVSIEDLKKR